MSWSTIPESQWSATAAASAVVFMIGYPVGAQEKRRRLDSPREELNIVNGDWPDDIPTSGQFGIAGWVKSSYRDRRRERKAVGVARY